MMLFLPGPGPSRLAFPLGFVMQSADGGLRDLSLQIHWIKQFRWHWFLQESQMIWNTMAFSICWLLLLIFQVTNMNVYLNGVQRLEAYLLSQCLTPQKSRFFSNILSVLHILTELLLSLRFSFFFYTLNLTRISFWEIWGRWLID